MPTPSWDRLRIIGNSRLIQFTIIMPIIGYLIVFNQHIHRAGPDAAGSPPTGLQPPLPSFSRSRPSRLEMWRAEPDRYRSCRHSTSYPAASDPPYWSKRKIAGVCVWQIEKSGRSASPSPRRGCRAFDKAEYSALPQITNDRAIISTDGGLLEADQTKPQYFRANPLSG